MLTSQISNSERSHHPKNAPLSEARNPFHSLIAKVSSPKKPVNHRVEWTIRVLNESRLIQEEKRNIFSKKSVASTYYKPTTIELRLPLSPLERNSPFAIWQLSLLSQPARHTKEWIFLPSDNQQIQDDQNKDTTYPTKERREHYYLFLYVPIIVLL